MPLIIPTQAASTVGGTDDPPEREDLVEDILDDGPVMAHQRRAVAHVWNERSVSKTKLHVLMLREQLGSLPMGRLATLVDVSLPVVTVALPELPLRGMASARAPHAEVAAPAI